MTTTQFTKAEATGSGPEIQIQTNGTHESSELQQETSTMSHEGHDSGSVGTDGDRDVVGDDGLSPDGANSNVIMPPLITTTHPTPRLYEELARIRSGGSSPYTSPTPQRRPIVPSGHSGSHRNQSPGTNGDLEGSRRSSASDIDESPNRRITRDSSASDADSGHGSPSAPADQGPMTPTPRGTNLQRLPYPEFMRFRIILDQDHKLYYNEGPVAGYVHLEMNDLPNLVKDIVISCRCHVVWRSLNAKVRKQEVVLWETTQRNSVPFDEEGLPAGSYEFPFRITLPPSMPGSLKTIKGGEHFMQISWDLSAFVIQLDSSQRKHMRTRTSITRRNVYHPAKELPPPIEARLGGVMKNHGGDTFLRCALLQDVITQNDPLKILVEIENNNIRDVTGLKLQIRQIIEYGWDSSHDVPVTRIKHVLASMNITDGFPVTKKVGKFRTVLTPRLGDGIEEGGKPAGSVCNQFERKELAKLKGMGEHKDKTYSATCYFKGRPRKSDTHFASVQYYVQIEASVRMGRNLRVRIPFVVTDQGDANLPPSYYCLDRDDILDQDVIENDFGGNASTEHGERTAKIRDEVDAVAATTHQAGAGTSSLRHTSPGPRMASPSPVRRRSSHSSTRGSDSSGENPQSRFLPLPRPGSGGMSSNNSDGSGTPSTGRRGRWGGLPSPIPRRRGSSRDRSAASVDANRNRQEEQSAGTRRRRSERRYRTRSANYFLGEEQAKHVGSHRGASPQPPCEDLHRRGSSRGRHDRRHRELSQEFVRDTLATAQNSGNYRSRLAETESGQNDSYDSLQQSPMRATAPGHGTYNQIIRQSRLAALQAADSHFDSDTDNLSEACFTLDDNEGDLPTYETIMEDPETYVSLAKSPEPPVPRSQRQKDAVPIPQSQSPDDELEIRVPNL
eukprot:Clim_evm120s149 gene=Clim_evmTU120s149